MPSWWLTTGGLKKTRNFVPRGAPLRSTSATSSSISRCGQVGRVGDGGRAHDEHRPRAVKGADPLQAAHDVGHVRAEDAGVVMGGVQLVDDHVFQVFEQAGPLGVVRQDARMQHVGVGDHDLRLLADGLAHAGRRVAVVGVEAQLVAQGLVQVEQLGQLVLGKGLGREQVQGFGLGVAGQGVQGGGVVDQGLARGGGRGHHRVPPLQDVLQRFGLVGKEALDAALLVDGGDLRAPAARENRRIRR